MGASGFRSADRRTRFFGSIFSNTEALFSLHGSLYKRVEYWKRLPHAMKSSRCLSQFVQTGNDRTAEVMVITSRHQRIRSSTIELKFRNLVDSRI